MRIVDSVSDAAPTVPQKSIGESVMNIEIKYIVIVPSDGIIGVNGEILRISYNVLPIHKNMHAIQYNKQLETGEIEFTDDYNQTLNAELYDEEVKPYVDLWIAEKERIEQERLNFEAEYNKLENVKTRKLESLNVALVRARSDSKANIMSSLGFSVNANDTAIANIDSLITYMESTNTNLIEFMTFDNTIKKLTLDNLKTIKVELSIYVRKLYAYKWKIREQIEQASTKEEVESIAINFSLAA